MFYNIFYGLLLFAGGILVLKYRKIIYEWTGGWGWAEHYLGRGGTVTALCLIACLMLVFWVATMFGKVEWWARKLDAPGAPQSSIKPSTPSSD